MAKTGDSPRSKPVTKTSRQTFGDCPRSKSVPQPPAPFGRRNGMNRVRLSVGFATAAALSATVISGCAGGSHSQDVAVPSGGSGSLHVPTRTCASGVSGELPHGWQTGGIRINGTWIYLWGAVRDQGHVGLLTAARFTPVSPRRYTEWKTMVIVSAGESVVVRVAPASVIRLRLAFEPGAASPLRLADGQRAERFVACPTTRTYFNGGLVVAGPQCARLDVLTPGGTGTSVVAALGRRKCG